MYVIVIDTEDKKREVFISLDEPTLRDTDELLHDFGQGQTKLTVHEVFPADNEGTLTYTYEGRV